MRISDWSSDVCSSDLDALAAAAKLAKIDGDYHAKYFEKEPSEFSKLLVGLFGPDEDDSTAAAPRGWFGLAAMKRELTERRLVQALSLLTRAGSVQAPCPDRPAHPPPLPPPHGPAANATP